ncbi:MAG: hypothetical protein NTZ09_10780 [Candidatus Hydrogenedentes bacterium]|nr:hypothetical protein [Candidatus Hydrogenedentota bacterium]
MLWLLVLILAAGDEPNLLQTPGFEEVSAGLPDHWNVFVMDYAPLEKPEVPAQGGVERAGREGANAAFLYNPAPYRSEPCNNWSQVVWGDLAGKKLRLSGAIKTEDATAAALWVQCWQRTPYKLLSVGSTSDKTPVTGTAGWRDVEMTVDVPAGTGFVMVRCVLRGKGKAWFDSLSLREVAEPPKPEASPAPKLVKPNVIPIPTPRANETPDIRELKSVADSLHTFSKANADLSEQVESLEQEIQALREQLKALEQAAGQVHTPEAASAEPSSAKRVPPLVPHGFKPEDLP